MNGFWKAFYSCEDSTWTSDWNQIILCVQRKPYSSLPWFRTLIVISSFKVSLIILIWQWNRGRTFTDSVMSEYARLFVPSFNINTEYKIGSVTNTLRKGKLICSQETRGYLSKSYVWCVRSIYETHKWRFLTNYRPFPTFVCQKNPLSTRGCIT